MDVMASEAHEPNTQQKRGLGLRVAIALFLLYKSASGYALLEAHGLDEIGHNTEAVRNSVSDLNRFGKVVKCRSFNPFNSFNSYCTFTPTTILASIILSALPGLIDINEAYKIWKVDKLDFLACVGAFFGVLFASVEVGLLVAICVCCISGEEKKMATVLRACKIDERAVQQSPTTLS
ncbi:hypothetical protein JHK86_040473 [Glycine max]|nr:hypothetical protein JHK86_040473 [Glycine max]